MTTPSQEHIEKILNDYHDDLLDTTLGNARVVQGVHVQDSQVEATIRLGFPAKTHGPELSRALTELLEAEPGVRSANVRVDSEIVAHSAKLGTARIQSVKNI